MPELPGYARVSTTEQNADLQRDALTGAGCWKVFTDHVTGTREHRPELDRLLEQIRPGDTLVVWRLDRLGRSLRHLIDVATDLGARGVGFRSLTENIDTTTAGGRLIFHVFGALAEFERELILERSRAGTAAARARGRMGGRPTVMTPDKAAAARRMYDGRELTVQQIADVLGVGRSSVYRALVARRRRALPDLAADTGGAAGGPAGLMSAPRPDPRTPSVGACPGCGRRPSSVEAAARLRAELAVRWLVREAGGLVARGFCHGCVPSGPVSEVVCGYCGDGPLLAGSLAGVDPGR